MKEFLKFKVSSGASSQDVDVAGTYYIPIDSILIVDNQAAAASGVNTFIVWQNTPNNGLVNFYTFELNTPPTNETYAAFNKTLEANPGGKSIEFQLPTGQEIVGWSFQGEATY